MTIIYTDVITNETHFIEHDLTHYELKESSFLDILHRVADELDPSFNYEFYLEGEQIEGGDLNAFVEQDDIITIIASPAGTALLGSALLKALTSMALSFVLSWVANALFGPKEVENERTDNASYSLNDQTNKTDIGNYMGVGYGRFRLYPRVINQPFIWYGGSNQFMGRIFAIGQGDYTLPNGLQVGSQKLETNADAGYKLFKSNGDSWLNVFDPTIIPSKPVTVKTAFTPKDNRKTALTGTKIESIEVKSVHSTMSKVKLIGYNGSTIISVAETQLSSLPLPVILSVTAKGNQYLTHYKIEGYDEQGGSMHFTGTQASLANPTNNFKGWVYDVVNRLDTVSNERINFPTTDFKPKEHTLSPDLEAVSINVVYPQGLWYVDSKGGKWDKTDVVKVEILNTSGGVVFTKAITNHSAYITNNAKDVMDAARFTYQFVKPQGADWSKVRVSKKVKDSTSQKDSVEAHLEAIYECFPNEPRYYGDSTLMYVMMKATEQTSGYGKINGFFERQGVGKSLKDIVTDIYSNKVYGAGLPANELEFDTQATHAKVDCYYDTNQTVLDAINSVIKPQMFHVTLKGAKLYVHKDVPRTLPVQRYDNTRMSDVTVSYLFDEYSEQFDSVEVEYRDSDWLPQTVKYPTTGISPKIIKTFGLENKSQAEAYAKYQYKQEKARRQAVTFKSDIQGRVPEFLDLIELKHGTIDSKEQAKMFQVIKVRTDEDTTQFECINYNGGIYS